MRNKINIACLNKIGLVVALGISLFFMSCNFCSSQYSYQPPVNVNDGIKIGSLLQLGMDSALVSKAIRKIKCGDFNEVHSMLIYKDDMLVLEEYFQGHKYQWDAPNYHGEYLQWDKEMIHPIMSCAKSFTSACIGIAIDKGFIKSADQKIFDYLPEHQKFNNGGKENITIEHLLTMTSGLSWNEWDAAHGTTANDIDRIYFECSDDPIKCVLERELQHPPGEVFNYNGGGMIMLGEILRNSSGLNIDEFSRKYLFGPQGIDNIQWFQYDNGAYACDGSVELTPRAMLKLGVTYLNNGRWKGERLLPAVWTVKSAETFNKNKMINIPGEDSGKNGYGYSWWNNELSRKGEKIDVYRAGGWGGQAIMVFPELEMVVVFTGGNYAAKSSLFKIVKRYILPAIR